MARPKKIKKLLPINEILATTDTQPRVNISVDVVKRYAEDLVDGAIFPPIIVFNEGEGSMRWYLADGYHRMFAHRDAGKEEILCEIWPGGLIEAKIYSWGANAEHGFQRSRKDTTRAVEQALQDPEIIAKYNQGEIADICKVTRRTVNRISQRLVLEEAEKKSRKDKKPVTPEPPTEGDLRESLPEPTQEEVDAGEIRQAVALIKGMPYGGEDADVLPLTPADIDDLEYVANWCSHAVLVWRKG